MWYSLIESKKMEKDAVAARVTTDSDSPWFSGHFPNDPILPGIAQLEMVANLIAASREDDLRMTGLSRIKFRKIVRPGEQLDIHVAPGNKERAICFPDNKQERGSLFRHDAFRPKREEIANLMNNDINQTITRIAEIIINELKLEDVTPETFDADLDLVDEVGIDSMDLATVALVLRDEYGIRIDEDDYPKLTTVRIIAEYIDNKLNSDE